MRRTKRIIKSIYFALIFSTLCFIVVLKNHFWMNQLDQFENSNIPLKDGNELSMDDLHINDMVVFKSPSDCECRHSIGLARDSKNAELYNVYELNDKKRRAGKLLYKLTQGEYGKATLTCNLYASLRRGKHQRVVAYSLFGQRQAYYNKLKILAKTVKKLYPGWFVRVYYDKSVNKSIICQVECQKLDGELVDNFDFCNVEKLELNLDGKTINGNYICKD